MNKSMLFLIVAVVAIAIVAVLFSSMQAVTMNETNLIINWVPLGIVLGVPCIIALAAFGALRFFKKMEPERALKLSTIIFLVTATIFLISLIILSTCIVDVGQCVRTL